ncbi:MAG: HAMP domain-containing histidine kinase [Bernardetiaceae bacterium]|jgi:signal transduction histidine kinase|nr:HAMP domain-containing histidine kinase [Bernardetiaceae bacterium]
MVSSLLLLAVFVFFWLRQVYDDQQWALRREADGQFRNTVLMLQDSLIRQSLRVGDSMPARWTQLSQNPDMATRGRSGAPLVRILTMGDSTLRLSGDTLTEILRVAANYQHHHAGGQMVFQLRGDTIPEALLRTHYQQSLAKAGLELPFTLVRNAAPHLRPPAPEKGFYVPRHGGPFPVLIGYSAHFQDYGWYLARKMLPEFLFSTFLIGITAAAFWVVYRHLEKQQRLTQLKNDFISNVTHELKTPVATVSVALEALSNFNALQNPKLAHEYLDISKNELQRLAMLIDQIMKTAIFEQKGVALQMTEVDLRQTVERVLASLKLQLDKQGAQVHLQVTPDDYRLRGDTVHLTNVVYNLVDNALKYSPENPEITVRLQRQNGQMALQVQDRGLGIAAEHQAKIFEKFYRVPSGNVHNAKGYGLGLNYVATVVEQHGGKVSVQSRVGEGSTFTVNLPVAQAKA